MYSRASSQKIVKNHQSNVILSYFKQNYWHSLVQYDHLLAHHLHCLLKYEDFYRNTFVQHEPRGFCRSMVFFFFFFWWCLWYSKLVYNFESLSLNTRRGSRVVHFTVLAPSYRFSQNDGYLSCSLDELQPVISQTQLVLFIFLIFLR